LLLWDLGRYFMPRTAVVERHIWEGSRRVFVDDARVRQVAVFVFLYLVIYGLGVMVLCTCGYNLSDSLFEFASSLGTVGLSVGVSTAGMPDAALWAEILAMFVGRFEIIVLIVSLIKLGKDVRCMAPGLYKKQGRI